MFVVGVAPVVAYITFGFAMHVALRTSRFQVFVNIAFGLPN